MSQQSSEICPTCGMEFSMPAEVQLKLRRRHNTFYCPNGHKQHYAGETEEENLKRQLSIARERADNWYKEAERLGRSNSALRGVITRMKNKENAK